MIGDTHTLTWGVLVDEPAPNEWQRWPRRARRACATAFDRSRALVESKHGAAVTISDESCCRPHASGRMHLYRMMVVRVR